MSKRKSQLVGKTVVSAEQKESWAEIKFDDGTTLTLEAAVEGDQETGWWAVLDIEVKND